MDLRERRKQETARLIRLSALKLARTMVVDTISVEAIGEKAGISQRTFFNYFPYKEAAFVLPPPPFPEDAVATFLDGGGSLLDALIELLSAQALALPPERWMIDVSRRAAEGNPKIAALQFASFRAFDKSLAELIASRLRLPEASVECRVIAAAMLAALRVVVDESAHGPRRHLAAAIRRDLQPLSALSSVQSHEATKPPTKQRQPERVGK